MNNPALKKFLSLSVNAEESWKGGVIAFADLIGMPPASDENEMAIALWCSTASELVHAEPFQLSDKSRLEGLVEAMLDFYAEHDFPFRPALIECNDRELAKGLSEIICDSGTNAKFVSEMTEWNALLQDFVEHFASTGLELPSLSDSGCSEKQIREFAEASAAFYRAAFWDYLEDVDLIKIETPKPPRYLKYAVVLGAASETYGLGFYDDADDHYDLMAQQADPRDLGLFSLTFESRAETSSKDVELWNELELPLETGEAFPTMTFFSEEQPRSPTPKELDFAIVVLRALAATNEEELDSGRWTKSVELLGKRKKCVLAIPNLIDPPDHAEWMRRGKMPERRGNERHFKLVEQFIAENNENMSLDQLNAAINAQFTGPLDDLTFPNDTPADRAEALCQEAIESFGRRRVQLARQALVEDPSHVEANTLLAESTRQVDRRIELFRAAVEHGKAQLGQVFEESVGHFWGLTDTRPYMRACHGLAAALHEAGQSNEAIQQYQELLRLNPNDNQGVRYEVIPLLLEQNREPEAIALLSDYREDSAFWHYMKSLVEFRCSGGSATSKKAMRAAFCANEHVVALLQSSGPPLFPDSYALGSPEEAAICMRELAVVWDETEGYIEWMFQEYFSWEKDRSKRLRDQKRKNRKKSASRRRKRK